ncbi:MAG: radical SAM protein [Deltaproteobacteria bacterium]|nr:MAG: radical SAM protein [Deltaproteobacteria bacterium]
MEPVYLETYDKGILEERVDKTRSILEDCHLCPRKCGVNRLEGEKGVCRTSAQAEVSSYGPHFGEERPLVGYAGSGTIFLTNCNLLCVFCQNYEISHLGEGYQVTPETMAGMMIDLQKQGCHNINFVTPTHVVPQILAALLKAIPYGLKIPLVYNCSGYEEVETLRLLDGIFDIYMPDFKFWDPDKAKLYCKAPDYPDKAREALKEMHRQVGDLKLNSRGIATRGLLVRHLVMTNNVAGTKEIVNFIAKEISKNTYVNIMNQYRPCGKAFEFKEIARPITRKEYIEAVQWASEAGLERLD